MKYLSLLLTLCCLSGCIENGGGTNDGPQSIIETGYLRCAPAADACDGALTCTNGDGQSACLEAEADACSGELSCACEGAWVCGDRDCVDVEGGFECREAPMRAAACAVADCGEPIAGGTLCDDGQPPAVTCERNDGGACEWVVAECEDVPAECAVEDCGEPIAGGIVCEDGQAPAVTCERNDGGACEWVVGECEDRSADREVTLDFCPPIEMANDPYNIRSAEIQGDTLLVGIEYSGGCADHGFTPCPSDFREAVPVQVTVGLYHESNGDACEAALSELIAIDVTWLREQYENQYGEDSGDVSITVRGPNGNEEVLYSF